MSDGIIKLPFILTAPNPRVPVITDYSVAIPALPGFHSWHSARAGALTLDGSGNIDSMLDRGSGGRTLGGVGAALRPVHVPDGINGKGSARFDGGDGFYYQGTFPIAAYSKIIVFRAQASTSGQVLMGHTTTSGINHRVYLDATTLALRHQVQNAAVVSGDTIANAGPVAPDVWHVAIATFDGTTGSVKVKLDDAAPAVLTKAGLTSIQDLLFFVGCGNMPSGIPSSALKGEIADIIVMANDVLATAQATSLALIRQYMAAAYRLPI